MSVPIFTWPTRKLFRDRVDDLAGLDAWWSSRTRDAVCLFGRRRVGKSWLFRAFADGKPAVILVADRRLTGPQMGRFADELEPALDVRPSISDLAELIRVCYRVGREQRVLVIIDEFPYLLPDGAQREATLSAVQRVMEEERDQSQTKLVLCGSLIAQMESLLAQSSPLHGRLVPLEVRPMTFSEARELLDEKDTPAQRVERFAITGGMARHLAELGQGDLRAAVCRSVLDRRGPLVNDPRAVLEQELRQPATYFSLLEELADGEKSVEHLARATSTSSKTLSRYLATLEAMRLVSARLSIGAQPEARGRRYRIDDGFIRFWFRFVFPHHDALAEGLSAQQLWNGEIREFLPDHVSPTFESLCLRYVRERFGREAPDVGSWWGTALNAERRAGRRLVEEIDVVGAHHRRLIIIGECKWTTRPTPKSVLDDLLDYKLPAIAQEGNLTTGHDGPLILLFSRTGFAPALIAAAANDHGPRVELVDATRLVAQLDHLTKAD
jgi:AAA+ ATPase superfamily predicted ATPase